MEAAAFEVRHPDEGLRSDAPFEASPGALQ
jgi:hypothetical protein